MSPQFLRYAGAGAIGTALHYAVLDRARPARARRRRRRLDGGRDRRRRRQLRAESPLHVREREAAPRALPRFALVAVAGIALNALVMTSVLCLAGPHYLVAQVVGDRRGARRGLSRESRMDVLSARSRLRRPRVGRRRGSISIVVPVYNEEAVLPEFHRRLAAVLDGLPSPAEIVYVNDGSDDGTMALLADAARRRIRASRSSISRATSARRSR